MIYGRSKFTLVKNISKQKGESRPIPVNEQTICGAKDINARTKIMLDDSYFVVEVTSINDEIRSKLRSTLCLEPSDELVSDANPSLDKSVHSISLGGKCTLLERPAAQLRNVPRPRLVLTILL